MQAPADQIHGLELALLRRGVFESEAERPRCRSCHRTPLIGERIHVYDSGSLVCDLCLVREDDEPLESRVVHTPAFGHTIRIVDRRAQG